MHWLRAGKSVVRAVNANGARVVKHWWPSRLTPQLTVLPDRKMIR